MRVLIIGNGAREHAMAWKVALSPEVRDIYCAPGNAGTALFARNVPIGPTNVQELAAWARENRIDLTLVGPEASLMAGVVDTFSARGLPILGPTREAALLEGSKVWAKDLLLRKGIPTASSFAFDSEADAVAYLRWQSAPIVVKADGLAAGKGVVVASSVDEAIAAVCDFMEHRTLGAAGDRVIIEEYLEGLEVSLLAFTDGETVVPMVPACDYKRVGDDDQGPNTGGMGAYSPPGFFGQQEVEAVTRTILEPTVRAMAEEGRPYKGVLYAGLMMTEDGPRVLEFNCRFGDPETQVILPRLRSDLVPIAQAIVDGRLAQEPVAWRPEAACGVVMASGGYPGSYSTGHLIEGLDAVEDGVLVFHAGTRERAVAAGERDRTGAQALGGRVEVETSGGRVLSVVALGADLAEARQRVYRSLARIHFVGCHYRNDIASRELAPAPARKEE